jgi:hypothetical protein
LTGWKRRGAIAGAALLSFALPGGLAALANAQSGPDESLRAQLGGTEAVYVPGLAATPLRQIVDAATAPLPVPPAAQPATPSNGCPPLIRDALGEAGCMVSFCESGWDPNITGALGEMGWFQVSPRWHADATYDPAGNVAAAVRISRGGTDWSQWTAASVLETGVCPTGVPYPG